ncbi:MULTISPECIES: hypothetical protein [Nosocomiicoccus]|uniref:Uncharacterized protein n=1 Tax=Nosocomiicoccus massiliensis TaxID=1232430 RepID=A0AAF0YJU2_9STAP|nr:MULTISPECIES: hypothetical protein [Nosocomiicoccus]MDK6863658.1 hypothetical protein [Nosocomiicoccus ampullae]OFL47604.1 hypothetical protein HMPREF2767_02665 [Nosocomiicoccus sp. HMSC067E10]OFO53109.1 hypothetical protein HMPREF3029_01510 [Nosocomiicoccus sp. HMSC059G07]OFS62839.1 hypothetical protein HMPREF3177_04475 [Nosocomiicoccus sp. HMSC09A07]WOS95965.1 hypothetical protein CJ229_007720 [Nosocomiicoccus massiliensis]
MQRELKRWTILDTINATLLIVVFLYVLDFQNNALVSWIFVIVFAFWMVTVISRNIIISRIRDGKMEDPTKK